MKKLILLLFVCFIFDILKASGDGESILLKKNSLKITFLSWMTGSTKLSYERLINEQALEFTSGIIWGGITGYDGKHNQPKGFTLRLAHKFLQWGKHKYSLKGPYLKQELIYSGFSYDSANDNNRKKSNMGALFGCVGYQWMQSRFSVDGFLGVGGALGVPADTHYQHGFIIWDFFDLYNKHIALTFGVKVGYCF